MARSFQERMFRIPTRASIVSDVDLLNMVVLICDHLYQSIVPNSGILHLDLKFVNLGFVEDPHEGSESS